MNLLSAASVYIINMRSIFNIKNLSHVIFIHSLLTTGSYENQQPIINLDINPST